MNERVYQDEAFEERVNYARHCLLTRETDHRAFDTCFEMHDGDLVVVRLLQLAEQDAALKTALQPYQLKEFRTTIYQALKDVPVDRLTSLARLLRNQFHGDLQALLKDINSGEILFQLDSSLQVPKSEF